MEKYKNIIRNIGMLLLVIPVVFFISCEDDTEDALPPVIEMIRSNDPDEGNVALDRGGLGQTIVIVGQNLHFTEEVYINDYNTFFNPTLATNTHLIVSINDDTPTFATHENVPNKIRVVNAAGSAEKDFTVLPPPPVVSTISNEFAHAGDELRITGQYFFFVEGVEFPGEIVGTDVTASSDGRSLTVVVPDGITEAGYVSVLTESGSGSSFPLYRFNDRTGMFADMDELNPFTPWGDYPVLGSSDPDPIDGYYIRVAGTNIPAPMWWDNDQVVPFDGGIVWPFLEGDPDNYAIKFELNTAETWNSGWFEVNLGWTYFYRFMPFNTPPSSSQYWEVGERHDFNTNGWQTMIIPLNRFRLKPGNTPDGDPISNLSQLDGMGMVMAFQNPDPPGGEVIPELHLCFDNFRLVPIN